MPRVSRQLSKSKVYHVMVRGNERKKIFLDNKDREKFIDTLREKNKERKFVVYAYCLMDNHVHLLINEGQDQITKIMQRIGVLTKIKKRTNWEFVRFYIHGMNLSKLLIILIYHFAQNTVDQFFLPGRLFIHN